MQYKTTLTVQYADESDRKGPARAFLASSQNIKKLPFSLLPHYIYLKPNPYPYNHHHDRVG